MEVGRLKLICSTCGQHYRTAVVEERDAGEVAYGQCDGCLIAAGKEPPPVTDEEVDHV